MTARLLPAVWVNGQPHAPDSLHLSAFDRGFTLADGLFETMRASGGVVFRLGPHLARLERGLEVLGFPAIATLSDWVLAAVRAASGSDLSVRVTVTRGAGPAGVAPPPDPRPTVVVAVNAMPLFPASVYRDGLVAQVAAGRRNQHAITAGLKTIGYTDAVAALVAAQRAGADEALFLDTDGHCSEATASNLFAVKDGGLVTPPASCGALPGVTRAAILEIAAGLGVQAVERPFGLDDLRAADEAFLTSSLRGIAPLVRVGTAPIGKGTPGPMTSRLVSAYAALVRTECDR
jgi:branched-chain amino acid aminotransferase